MLYFSCADNKIIIECLKKGHSSWNDKKITVLKAKIKEALKKSKEMFAAIA